MSLEQSVAVKLLTEQHLELLSLKVGCTGLSESTLVKMPHCWTDKSPLGQKPSRTKAHWTISHWTKAHCLIWQGGQKPTSLKKKHLELLSSKVGCTGLSESTLVKMPHCWKSGNGQKPTGTKAQLAFVQWAFVLVGFCPSGLLSYTLGNHMSRLIYV